MPKGFRAKPQPNARVNNRGTQIRYSGLKLAPMIIAGFSNLILAHILGVFDFGLYASAQAISQIIFAIGLFGQDQIALRRGLSVGSALRRSSAIVLASTSTCLVVSILFAPKVPLGLAISVIASNATIQWCIMVQVLAQSCGYDLSRARWELLVRGSNQVALVLFAIILGSALMASIGGVLATTSAAIVVVFRFLRMNVNVSLEPSYENSTYSGMKHGAIGLLYAIAITIPPLLLAVKSSADVNAQARFIVIAYTASSAISGALYGEYYRVRAYQADPPVRFTTVWASMKKSYFLIAPTVSAGLLVAAFLLPALLGPAYAEASLGIIILAVAAIPQFFGAMVGSMMLANGYFVATIVRYLIAGAVTVGLTLLFGLTAQGFAFVLLCNECLGALMYIASRRMWFSTPTLATR